MTNATWALHPYPRDGREIATSVGPKGGAKLIVRGSASVLTDTARNRNTRMPELIVRRDPLKVRSYGSGVVHTPVSKREVSRRHARLKVYAIAQALGGVPAECELWPVYTPR